MSGALFSSAFMLSLSLFSSLSLLAGPKVLRDPRPLHAAVKEGNIAEIENLVGNGYDIDTGFDDKIESTALSLAISLCQKEAFKKLVDLGAYIDGGRSHKIIEIGYESPAFKLEKLLEQMDAKISDLTQELQNIKVQKRQAKEAVTWSHPTKAQQPLRHLVFIERHKKCIKKLKEQRKLIISAIKKYEAWEEMLSFLKEKARQTEQESEQRSMHELEAESEQQSAQELEPEAEQVLQKLETEPEQALQGLEPDSDRIGRKAAQEVDNPEEEDAPGDEDDFTKNQPDKKVKKYSRVKALLSKARARTMPCFPMQRKKLKTTNI